MAAISSPGAIKIETQVAVFLQTLAEAQYIDVMLYFGIARSTVYDCVHKVCDAVTAELSLSRIPETERTRKKKASGFATSRGLENPRRHCCGALDGIVIKICKPVEVADPGQYCNRKGYYGIQFRPLWTLNTDFVHVGNLCSVYT